jgi:hypothetical protein
MSSKLSGVIMTVNTEEREMNGPTCRCGAAIGARSVATAIVFLLAALVADRQTAGGQSVPPSVAVVVAAKPPEVEQYAAEQLCYYLEKLYGIPIHPAERIPAIAQIVFVIGSPPTNPAVAKALGPGGWPSLSDQGFVLKRGQLDGKPALVIGGGSPKATLWAVYDLIERWGVRYLLHGDVLPEKPGTLKLPAEDIVQEPVLRVRQWRVINDFACGPESWGMADYRPVLDQLAKLKFNRILVMLYPWQPFLHLEIDGLARRQAWLWYDFHYPITDDMPGRRLFGSAKEFWNPDLPRGASYRDFVAAGERLVHSLMSYARGRGMQCSVVTSPLEYPPEFKALVPNAQPVHQLAEMTVVPGADAPPDHPALERLASITVRNTVNTYPEADFLAMNMPEFRQWSGLYKKAWDSLDSRYGISKSCSLDSVLAAVKRRPDYPGGLDRAVQEVKGDLVALAFFDRLFQQLHVLDGTRRPDVKLVYYFVAEELFPILDRIMPAGSEMACILDYTSSNVLKRREVLGTIGKKVPMIMVYTLHDDNVGILPQLTTGSLARLTAEQYRYGWTGFSARYWLTGDHDPCVTYLARAAWDRKTTRAGVCADLIGSVCGKQCVADLTKTFDELERVTISLEGEGLGLTFPVPGMIEREFVAASLPRLCVNVREGYRHARAAAAQAAAKSRPAGKAYADYWVGRLDFGIGYFDCVEAVRRATTLRDEAEQMKKAGKPAEAKAKKAQALAELKRALELSRSMLESYARVAQDQSDRGAIATMAEYVYRPLKTKVQQWSAD